MRDASPAFQPDLGAGGFQLAEAGGFQTQGPVGALDVCVVVSFSCQATGPVAPVRPPSGAVWTIPRTRTYRGALEACVVVSYSCPATFSSALDRDDEEVLLLMAHSARRPAAGGHDHAVLLALIEEDDRIVERLRPSER